MPMPSKFYLTFGQNHPAKDGWIEVYAASYDDARSLVENQYGTQWSMLYEADRFKPEYFPAGCLGVLQ